MDFGTNLPQMPRDDCVTFMNFKIKYALSTITEIFLMATALSLELEGTQFLAWLFEQTEVFHISLPPFFLTMRYSCCF